MDATQTSKSKGKSKMNYIKRLQNENKNLKNDKNIARAELLELEKYLLSPKFYNDPTVQIRDVLTRMEALKSTLM